MKAYSLADRVLGVVMDSSFDETSIVELLNDCAGAVSRRFIIPSLDATATVTALSTGPSVSLPVDFQRNLYFCDDGTSFNDIEVCNSKDQLARYYAPGLTKKATLIRGVAAVRPVIYYAPIPIADTALTLRYQKKPPAITLSTELDDHILPYGFTDIWENYVLWKLFAKIEQGMEGQKVDTNYYMNLFIGYMDELSTSYKEGVSLPPPPIAVPERW